MVARLPNMEVFAGTHAAFAPQIPRLVNVKSVFTFGQLGKGDLEARGMAAQNSHSFPLDLIGLKDSDGVVHLVDSII